VVFEPEPQVTSTPLVAVPFTETCPTIVAPLDWASAVGIDMHTSAVNAKVKPAIMANLRLEYIILSPVVLVEWLPEDV
jgi:hypothetical protein